MEKVQLKDITSIMAPSLINYAMSVITDRALADVKDGLKPVQRRILYCMYEEGLSPNTPYRKSARTVGNVLGKYHPHGDSSIYGAMVTVAQDFGHRYPIIDGQGNFGSVDGDSAAAMRYTESRLTRYGYEMMKSIDKGTVEWLDNYDASEREPAYLASLIPNLLANGTSGIAVGMASHIPPHNLTELYDALIYIIDKAMNGEEATLPEIMQFVKGPDFPLGASIINAGSMREIFETGRGSVIIRSTYTVDTNKIIFTDIPYKKNKSAICERIADLIKNDQLPGVRDVEDHSNKDGIEIVVVTKAGYDTNIIINNLFKKTDLQASVSYNMNMLVNGVPMVLGLTEMLGYFLEHAANVVVRRSQFEFSKAAKRLNIVEGTIKAKELIDQITDIVKQSNTDEELNAAISALGFNSEQTNAILSMQLRSLSKANISKLNDEKIKLEADSEYLNGIIGDQSILLTVLKSEFQELQTKLGDKRRTEIMELDDSIDMEDLIVEKEVIITLTDDFCIKLMSSDAYQTQGRGGKGVKASTGDRAVSHIINTTNKSSILFLTDKGRCYRIKAYKIPETTKSMKPKSINNYLTFQEDEKIISVMSADGLKEGSLLFITRKGIAKRLDSSQISTKYQSTQVLTFKEDDALVSALIVGDNTEFIISTANGTMLRTDTSNIRPMGRQAAGVKGIKLKAKDYVIDASVVNEEHTLLVISANGLGKRTKFSQFPSANRGAQGVIGYKPTKKSGLVVAVHDVADDDEMFIATSSGKMIRVAASAISELGRSAAGVKVVNLDDDDTVSAISIIRGVEIEEDTE
jgi:DNA gyrase subunit A